MSTIAAVSTAQGQGAIGIVRISGPLAHTLLTKVFRSRFKAFTDFKPWVLHRGFFKDSREESLDDVLAVFMPAPHTYTGEDMAEIQCHGNPLILNTILQRLFSLGASPAQAGEFTKRAFLAGRIDLSQAEAVAEMVSCVSRRGLAVNLQRLSGALSLAISQARSKIDALRAKLVWAVDFPEEEIEGLSPEELKRDLLELKAELFKLKSDQVQSRILQEGARVVLIGSVNAGKSSLLNALLGRERALVTSVPGTTRDFLEEYWDLNGVAVRLFDTAGLRAPAETILDPIEQLGIERSKACAKEADCLLMVLDGEQWTREELEAKDCPKASYKAILEEYPLKPKILVWNKLDQVSPLIFPPKWAQDLPSVALSAKIGIGFDSLFKVLRATLLGDQGLVAEQPVSLNLRQAHALDLALAELEYLIKALNLGDTYDCLAVRLEMVANHLLDITGVSTSAEVLNEIFSKFCIGK
ncbi:MAG: tRNA uridine-5-carboxymethylaminomethyl(34) synthesis GTPase MnmE [Desulfovibrionaceae bacterium]|nr:tRNA uridine-5-carboxymethylaminomethyl(34) synthesis GTPase MnmE [Desulfovibrionaceae bacterium]